MKTKRVFDQEIVVLKEDIQKMGLMVKSNIEKAIISLQQRDRLMAEDVIKQDDQIDKMELQIDEECIQLIALRQPEASDLRFIATAMNIATDLERIGDLAEDIAEQAIKLMQEPLLKPLIDIPKMAKLAQSAVDQGLDAFIACDAKLAVEIWEKEKQTDLLRDLVHDELVGIMQRDSQTVTRAIPLLLISRHLERIVDHVTNIAEDVIYMVEAKVVKHGGAKDA